ncbi:helix-turn-helix transcriptional regulator [Paenirhodobacter enshiensis]|uniref:helix-turn-helix transcriptional regulator n=1 Tax=Paenirhodobacter enshiensis TaxID=1105367 RepID=UPI00068F8D18|nr:helix-turn-helix transcriptional regulator [Paenirhodobacter enshiensis]
MAGSVHSDAYRSLLKALIALRTERAMSQADLAAKLRKPPSFVGKYELGERRLDVIELLVILRELDADFESFWAPAAITLPDRL